MSETGDSKPGIGVFLCRCGKNIAPKIDLERLEKALLADRLVKEVVVCDLGCSDEGQETIKGTIRNKGLDRIVVGACSPKVHGHTFQKLMEECGLNKYLCEIANLREQCAWVHSNKETATDKAIKMTRMAVAKVALNEPLETLTFDINKDVLVLGGGITGIQAALTVANKGRRAILLDKSPTLGGNLAAMAKVAPPLECAACILMGKARDLHKIEVLTSGELLDIKGRIGNFTATVKKRPRYVDVDRCSNCGTCAFDCQVSVDNEFESGLNQRKAIYLPYPHAYPLSHVIDMDNCNRCAECVNVCEENAIDLDQKEETVELKVGAIVVATGSRPDLTGLDKYGFKKIARVMDFSQFERLVAESGPTFGEPVDFSFGDPYMKVAFIQVPADEGSSFRAMDTIAKYAALYKERNADGQAYVICQNPGSLRAGENDSVEKVKQLPKVDYIEGRVAECVDKGEGVSIKYTPKAKFEKVDLDVDLAVLVSGLRPAKLPDEMVTKLSLEKDPKGFYREPVPNIGITVAGACAGADSFDDCMREGERAGLMALGLLTEDKLRVDPTIAVINPDLCGGCAICVPLCPNGAIEIKDEVAVLDEALCEGCGTCVAACPSGASIIRNMEGAQFFRIIDRAIGV